MLKVERGEAVLGSQIKNDGINFAIFSKNAYKVVLNIFEKEEDIIPIFSYKLNNEENRTGDIWHIFIKGVAKNTLYTWQIDGIKNDMEGHIFDFENNLLDPYGKIYIKEENSSIRKTVAVDEKYLDRIIKRPKINKKDIVVYEMHVGLFTNSETSKVKSPGTFSGALEKIEHLKKLGITTIELMPIFEFKKYVENKNIITGEKLENIWGYNPINFFALTDKYSSSKGEGSKFYEETLKEFVEFVDKIHSEGIEIILDVVYNHTAEGNEDGEIYNFKGMDNSIFYILENNKRYYTNYSGTGNTVNCNHQVVKTMIIDSLRFWYSKVGVDGFRFDLGAILGRGKDGKWIGGWNSLIQDIEDDPILSHAKLFTEAWDAGGGYYLDEFPKNYGIWNGKYRDCVRCFIKGDMGVVYELAQRLKGSPDIFKFKHKTPLNSLNFITAHDGFTIFDLVSYDNKHNIQNGERNRDGENNNHSWNHGIEGETPSNIINELRERQIRNMFLILMMSQGVPMIYMGDEMGKTQFGNNNAYCQNNKLNWINWERKNDFKNNFVFLCNLIEFRKKNRDFFESDYRQIEKKMSFHGVKPFEPDYNYQSHTLAMMINGENCKKVYVALNSYDKPLEFQLPKLENGKWYLVTDTNLENGKFFKNCENEIINNSYKVKERSSIIAIFQ